MDKSDNITDRAFWQAIRAALLAMVAAIDRKYRFGKYARTVSLPITQDDSISGLVDNQ